MSSPLPFQSWTGITGTIATTTIHTAQTNELVQVSVALHSSYYNGGTVVAHFIYNNGENNVAVTFGVNDTAPFILRVASGTDITLYTTVQASSPEIYTLDIFTEVLVSSNPSV